ncbi:MAG: hybrid sensor histidine kinase/response regulator [Capsulimonas sp.]|nr:hybrid sensor histidine kinase/response regulator [Capsulimonas sp.]
MAEQEPPVPSDPQSSLSPEKAIPRGDEHFRLLVESAKEYAIFTMGIDRRVTSWNSGAERILGYSEPEILGNSADIIFTPEDRAANVPQQEYERALREDQSPDIRWHQRKDGSRFWAEGFMVPMRTEDGRLYGLAKILRDMTERKRIEDERQHAVEELKAAHAQTTEILESITDAFYAVDENFNFTYVNRQAEEWWRIRREDLIGKHYWTMFPQAVDSEAYLQHLRVMSERRPAHFETFSPVIERWIDVHLYPSRTGLSAYFRDISARKRAEDELTARAARETLLNQVSAAIRSSLDPDLIQLETAAVLTSELKLDRCWFFHYDTMQNSVQIRGYWRDPHRPYTQEPNDEGLYDKLLTEILPVMSANAIGDIESAPLTEETRKFLSRLGLRSLLAVPLFTEGSLTSGLILSMSKTSRAWHPEEMRLAEAVAAQLRPALEAARIAQRESRIASQLQQALQPPLPENTPGLQFAQYYRPALEEAGVGGDFYDVYPLTAHCTAIVLGDLSGKGLAAAAQVATVRNMLRATLYLGQTIAEAVTNLNEALATHGLVHGFSTLFVSVYDSRDRQLRYVNCGQEPALLGCEHGQVEQLWPTGPILAAFADSKYSERSIPLAPGDVLAIFTDGMTEVGPTRVNMLGVEGVAAILSEKRGLGNAQEISRELVREVDDFARGGVRDDVCLLVGVVR